MAQNADFTYFERIGQEEALKRVRKNYALDETPHGHYHILDLLISYRPDLFCAENAPFVGFDDFICKEFKEIHDKELRL